MASLAAIFATRPDAWKSSALGWLRAPIRLWSETWR